MPMAQNKYLVTRSIFPINSIFRLHMKNFTAICSFSNLFILETYSAHVFFKLKTKSPLAKHRLSHDFLFTVPVCGKVKSVNCFNLNKRFFKKKNYFSFVCSVRPAFGLYLIYTFENKHNQLLNALRLCLCFCTMQFQTSLLNKYIILLQANTHDQRKYTHAQFRWESCFQYILSFFFSKKRISCAYECVCFRSKNSDKKM